MYVIGNYTLIEIEFVLTIISLILLAIAYHISKKNTRGRLIEKVKYYKQLPRGLEPELLQHIHYKEIAPNSFYIAFLNLVKLGIYKIEVLRDDEGIDSKYIVYNPENEVNLKEHQKIMIDKINVYLKPKEDKRCLKLDSFLKKMKANVGINIKAYNDALKKEKEDLLGTVKDHSGIAIVFFGMILVLFIAFVAFITTELKDNERTLIIFFMAMMAYAAIAMFSPMKLDTDGKKIQVFIVIGIMLVFFAPFEVVIISYLNKAGMAYLWVIYTILEMACIYSKRTESYSNEENQISEYLRGLKNYIDDFCYIQDEENITTIDYWEDYFIMSIAFDCKLQVSEIFFEYGKEEKRYTNFGFLLDTYKDLEEFNSKFGKSFEFGDGTLI